MGKLLAVLMVIGLVGLGLIVCGIAGWFAWQHIGLILSVLFVASVGILFTRRVVGRVREAQGIEDHVYKEGEDV